MTLTSRQPAIFISHGGGPWPFVDMPFVPAGTLEPLVRYLRALVTGLASRPKAALVVSAHWEEPVATLMTNPTPPMLYDHTGYEQKAYELQWPAPGATFLVDRVTSLLSGADFPTANDPARGFDHGTFIPLMVALPAADLPVLQISLLDTLD